MLTFSGGRESVSLWVEGNSLLLQALFHETDLRLRFKSSAKHSRILTRTRWLDRHYLTTTNPDGAFLLGNDGFRLLWRDLILRPPVTSPGSEFLLVLYLCLRGFRPFEEYFGGENRNIISCEFDFTPDSVLEERASARQARDANRLCSYFGFNLSPLARLTCTATVHCEHKKPD